MVIFKEALALQRYVREQKERLRKIGFVPTMGALHKGHLSLIEASRREADITVCSIFVNPAQFNNPDDFKHYPVTIEQDVEMLTLAGCDVLFLPAVSEIYPPGFPTTHYPLGNIETILEGAHRPGHFQGVCLVVDRLLQLVAPAFLYLGQKDLQQCLVISKLLAITGQQNIALRIVPTMREPDGLAMSSRNLRLSASQRKAAVIISKQLDVMKETWPSANLQLLKERAKQELEKEGFVVDYVEVAHADDLLPAQAPSGKLVGLIAASIGPVRLIDNMFLN